MGDRCNIVMRQEKGDIFFYGHWNGSDFVHAVKRALQKKLRWEDPPYLARIVWDEFCPERGQETGYGIGVRIADNEHDLCVIDADKKTVSRCRENHGRWDTRKSDIGEVVKTWSFDDFINLTDDDIDKMEW